MRFTDVFRDGLIYIGSLVMSREQFLSIEPDYMLPEGMVKRLYLPSKELHKTYDADGNEYHQPYPWDQGDYYLRREAIYHKALV